MLVRHGFAVEFIPRTNDKTPDLKISDRLTGRHLVNVECKYREFTSFEDKYKDVYKFYEDCLTKILSNTNRSIRVMAAIVGTACEATFDRALKRVEQLARNDFRGQRIETDAEMSVSIQDHPLAPEFPYRETEEALADPAFARHVVRRNNEILMLSDGFIFNIESDNYKKLNNILSKSRSQLASDVPTIVYFGVKLAGAIAAQHNVMAQMTYRRILYDYITIMSAVLSHRLWGQGQNTRIGAVVLRGGPVFREVYEYGIPYYSSEYLSAAATPPEFGYGGPDPRELIKRILARH
jgi:hypothetical protein